MRSHPRVPAQCPEIRRRKPRRPRRSGDENGRPSQASVATQRRSSVRTLPVPTLMTSPSRAMARIAKYGSGTSGVRTQRGSQSRRRRRFAQRLEDPRLQTVVGRRIQASAAEVRISSGWRVAATIRSAWSVGTRKAEPRMATTRNAERFVSLERTEVARGQHRGARPQRQWRAGMRAVDREAVDEGLLDVTGAMAEVLSGVSPRPQPLDIRWVEDGIRSHRCSALRRHRPAPAPSGGASVDRREPVAVLGQPARTASK